MRTLPERVYFKHGAYYYVTPEKQWVRLGKTEAEAVAKYSTIVGSPDVLSTMNRVFDKYTIEVIPQKAPRTQRDNLSEMKNLRAVFGAMRPTDVKPRHIAQYLALRDAKVRANREVALLQHVFKKALNWGVVEVNPCLGIDRNPEYPRDRYVTDQELQTFLQFCPTWLQLYVRLKYLTGLRQGDLLRLKWGDISSTHLSISISKSGRGVKRSSSVKLSFEITSELDSVLQELHHLGTGIRSNSMKQGSTRRPSATTSELTQEELSSALFVTRYGSAVTASGLDSAWDRVWARIRATGLQLEHFREHDIRAKTATDADDQGMDATSLLAHSSRKMTETYIRGRKTRKLRPLK